MNFFSIQRWSFKIGAVNWRTQAYFRSLVARFSLNFCVFWSLHSLSEAFYLSVQNWTSNDWDQSLRVETKKKLLSWKWTKFRYPRRIIENLKYQKKNRCTIYNSRDNSKPTRDWIESSRFKCVFVLLLIATREEKKNFSKTTKKKSSNHIRKNYRLLTSDKAKLLSFSENQNSNENFTQKKSWKIDLEQKKEKFRVFYIFHVW